MYLSRCSRALLLLLSLTFVSTYASLATAREHFLDTVPEETPYLVYYEMTDDGFTQFSDTWRKIPLPSDDEILSRSVGAERLISLCMTDLLRAYQTGQVDQLGLPPWSEMKVGAYGLGFWPVVSLAVRDQKRAMKWIVKKAKQAGMKLTQKGNQLQISDKQHVPVKLWVTPRGADWMNIALVPQRDADLFLSYVSGVKKPEVSAMASNTLSKLIKRSGIRQDKLVWLLNTRSLLQTLFDRGEGINRHFSLIGDAPLKATAKSCFDEYLQLADTIPFMAFGLTQTPQDRLGLKLFFAFSEQISKVTRTFNSASYYDLPSDQAQVYASSGINLRGIMDGLQQLLQHLLQSPFTCPQLANMAPKEQLQKVSSQLMMFPPFLYDLQGVSVSLDKISPQPRGGLLISAKNIVNLLNIAQGLKPELAQLGLPAVGAGPKLLKAPPGKSPIPFKIYVDLKSDALGVSMGSESVDVVSKAISAQPSGAPALITVSYDTSVLLGPIKQYLRRVHEVQRKVEEERHASEVELAKREGRAPPPALKASDDLDLDKTFEGYQRLSRVTVSVQFTDRGLEVVTESLIRPEMR